MERLDTIVTKIIELLAKENCTIDETISVCMAVQKNIEKTTMVQFEERKLKNLIWF